MRSPNAQEHQVRCFLYDERGERISATSMAAATSTTPYDLHDLPV